MVPNERFVEIELPVPLSEDEARKLAVELAGVDRDLILLEVEMKEEARAYKKRIEEKKKRRVELIGIIHDKVRKERRQVRVTYDFANGVKYTWSPFQTGVILKEEPITDEERTEVMFKLGPAEEGAEQPEGDQIVTDAEITTAIEAVACRRCGTIVAETEATKVEVRDPKTKELLGTEFECPKHRANSDQPTNAAEYAEQAAGDAAAEQPDAPDGNDRMPE